MTPRVFIIEPAKATIDVSTARKFGEIVPIFGNGSRRASVFQPTQYGVEVVQALEDLKFDPDVDFFIMTGALLPTAVALAAMAEKYKKIRLLMFSSHDSIYVNRDYVIAA